MRRAGVLLLGCALLAPVGRAQSSAGQGPAPQIQNGRVEPRPGTSIDREITAASSGNPSWIAWRVQMVAGDRDLCSWYSDRLGTVRGLMMDDERGLLDSSRPQIAAPAGPKPIEAGTGLIVLLRLVDGSVERIRTAGDDCPIDAGGRTVGWMSNVTPAESLRFLNAVASVSTDRSMLDLERQMATLAVRAIGLHADASANTLLETIATKNSDSSVRQQAATSLGAYRGPAGVAALTRLLAAAPVNPARASDDRRNLVVSLGQSPRHPRSRRCAVSRKTRTRERDPKPGTTLWSAPARRAFPTP